MPSSSSPKAATYARLPRHARQAGQGDRRVDRQHARSHPRHRQHHGHAHGQGTATARSRSRTTSGKPGRCASRRQAQGGHADGQYGHRQPAPFELGWKSSGPASSAMSAKCTSGPIAPFASETSIGPKTATKCPRTWLGPLARHRSDTPLMSATSTIPSPGVAGGISAPAPWETWPATR